MISSELVEIAEPITSEEKKTEKEQFIRYEDVKNQSTESYFKGNEFSIDAFNKKYTKFKGETYVQALKRVCDYIASAEETEEKKRYWSERWFDEIYQGFWHPAGSIMQGADSGRNVSMANCTTISLGTGRNDEDWDNLESIIKNTGYNVAKCAAFRQGLGVDFSRLRPNKAKVLNSANESTGSLHWMKFVDSLGYYVGQKGRIPAMLFSLSCTHPDVIEFIKLKADYTKIQNANISVQCTDALYKAAESDQDWNLEFEVPELKIGDKVYIHRHSADRDSCEDDSGKFYNISTKNRPYEKITKVVKAREVLELIAKCMFANAEPGIQNIDIAKKYSNSDYVYNPDDEYDSRIVSSNACCVGGETKILTNNGYLPIKELIGKTTTIWNGIEWSDVTPDIMGYNQPMVKVALSDGTSLVCTENHKWCILTDNGEEFIEAINLKSEDTLAKYKMPVVEESREEFKHAYTHGFFCGDGHRHGRDGESKAAFLYGDKKEVLPFLETTGNNPLLSAQDRICSTFPKDMAPKFFVPINARLQDRLDWFAGLIDADGSLIYNPNSIAIQISTVNLTFAEELRLFLTTLGVQAKIGVMHEARERYLPDGRGGEKLYPCQKCYRLCLNASGAHNLVNLGLKTHRIKLEVSKPNRDARRFVTVESVEPVEIADKVYCFNEPKNHTGCFNGIITGQSEQYLSLDSLCVLASLNAVKFPIVKYKQSLQKIAHSINRFLDNVNEKELQDNTCAIPYQKLAIKKLRRTGAGITNIGGLLFKANVEYGSREGNDFVEEFQKWYNYYLYESSISLGKEKGSFGLFNRGKLEKSPFIQRMMSLGLVFEALRNITTSSIAPTGTLSLMFNDLVMSYGVEPSFGLAYWKRTRISGHYEYYFCVPNIVRETFAKAGYRIPIDSDTVKDTWDGKIGKSVIDFINKHKDKLGIRFKSATDVSVFDKLDLMSGLAKYVDSSISVTYMLPEKTDWKDIYKFIVKAHKNELKSIAAFPDRKMYGIVSFVPFKELAVNLVKENVVIHDQNFTTEELKDLKTLTSIDQSVNIHHVNSDIVVTERPKSLPCDVHHMKVRAKDDTGKYYAAEYFVLVGLNGQNPHEIFCGKNGHIPKDVKTGNIIRHKSGHYEVAFDNGLVVDNIAKYITENEEAITRMTSLLLRSHVPIIDIVSQLEKVATDDLLLFARSMARSLKLYIKDGTKQIGEKCPSCGGVVVRMDGCRSCVNCNASVCN